MERITIGSGKLYIAEFENTIPEDIEIEKETNLLGYIQGGATLVYSPSFYEAKDDLGIVSKKMITDEEVTLKSGVLTWNGNTLKNLVATARVEEDKTKKTRTVKIGGAGNYNSKKYVLHFVHEDKVDGDIRITIVGSNDWHLQKIKKPLSMQNLRRNPMTIKVRLLFIKKRIAQFQRDLMRWVDLTHLYFIRSE